LTSPAPNSFVIPGSTINLAAQTSHPSGTVSEVEFFANGRSIGDGVAGANGVFTLSWPNVESNIYSVWAVAMDAAHVHSHSVPITLTVNNAPTVAVSSPFEGQRFESSPNIGLAAAAEDSDGQIAKVDFYANGSLIGSASDIDTDRFNLTWRIVPDGQYSLTETVTDNLGM